MTTSTPTVAHAWAIPLPIVPAPITPTVAISMSPPEADERKLRSLRGGDSMQRRDRQREARNDAPDGVERRRSGKSAARDQHDATRRLRRREGNRLDEGRRVFRREGGRGQHRNSH